MTFSVFRMLYSHHSYRVPEGFHHPKPIKWLLSAPGNRQPPICFLSLRIYLFQILHINYHKYVIFCVWHLSLNITLSGFIHIVACQYFIPVKRLSNISQYVSTTFCPFTLSWTFVLSLLFGCCKQCCCQHACTYTCLCTLKNSSVCIPRSGIAGFYSSSLYLCEDLLYYSSQRLNHFIFPPAMCQGSSVCVLSSACYCPFFFFF